MPRTVPSRAPLPLRPLTAAIARIGMIAVYDGSLGDDYPPEGSPLFADEVP